MNRLPPRVVADDEDPIEAGPTLSRIGRRSDSRVLTLVSAAAIVFLAVAIAKPWSIGTPPPLPSGSTTSLAAIPEPAATSDAPPGSPAWVTWPATSPPPDTQPASLSYVVSIESGGWSIAVTGCTESVYRLVLPSALASSDAATDLPYVDATLVCASGAPGQIYWVLPSPSAP